MDGSKKVSTTWFFLQQKHFGYKLFPSKWRRKWRRSGVFIVNFEYISQRFLSLLSTLNKCMLASFSVISGCLTRKVSYDYLRYISEVARGVL